MKKISIALITAAAIVVTPLAVPSKASADPVTVAAIIGGGLIAGSVIASRDRVYVESECRIVRQRVAVPGGYAWRRVEVCD